MQIGISLLITTNLGIPHASSEADIYNGYFIPQGNGPCLHSSSTLLILNRHHCLHECLVNISQSLAMINLNLSRAITRNEAKYPRPEEFHPEHFFDAAGELNDDIVPYAFGAGRRICPGRHFAEASIWSAIVTILATLDIIKCKDKQGNDIPVDPKWSPNTVSYVSLSYRSDLLNIERTLIAIPLGSNATSSRGYRA